MNQRAILAFLLSFCTLAQVVAQTRPALTNGLPLSPDLEPGSYYLQVVVTDKTRKRQTAPRYTVGQLRDREVITKLGR